MTAIHAGAASGALVLLLAAAAAAQPELSVTVTAPEPTPPFAFAGTGGEPVELAISSGEAVGFAWSAAAAAEYRIGWNLVDPDDPDDPGWLAPGYDPALVSHTGPAFVDGVFTFTVSARDQGGETRGVFLLTYLAGVPTRAVGWGALHAAYGPPAP